MFTGSDTGLVKLAYPEVSDLKYPWLVYYLYIIIYRKLYT